MNKVGEPLRCSVNRDLWGIVDLRVIAVIDPHTLEELQYGEYSEGFVEEVLANFTQAATKVSRECEVHT